MNHRGFGLMEAVMAMGIGSIALLTLFSSFSQAERVRIYEKLSTSGQFLAHEIGRVLSDEAVCPQNLTGKVIPSGRPLQINEIRTRTGAVLVSTAPGKTYYGGISVPKIELSEKEKISATESRVLLTTTMEFKGVERTHVVEGFVDLAGNQIAGCRMMGTNSFTLKEMCGGIEGASFNENTGKCEIEKEGKNFQMALIGGNSDAWRVDRTHVSSCPEGSAVVAMQVNGHHNGYFHSVRLLCKNIGKDGSPTGPEFWAPEQAGKSFHGSSAWADNVWCPNDSFAVGYELETRTAKQLYASSYWVDLYGFKYIRLICAKKGQSTLLSSPRSRTPVPNYGSTGPYRTVKKFKDFCGSGTLLKSIRAENSTGNGSAGEQYLSGWRGYCS